MISALDVISQLQAETPYIISYSTSTQPNLDYEGTPLIYVGYIGFKSTIANMDIDFNEYNINGEGIFQTFELQIVCEVADFETVWKTTYKTLNAWNPVADESIRTACCYTEGVVLGLDNGIQRSIDRWRIGFSTVANDF